MSWPRQQLNSRLVAAFANACRRHHVSPTPRVLIVEAGPQRLTLLERLPRFFYPGGYHVRRRFRCSTSRFGTGQQAGSNQTPLGLHRVAEKIGHGWPSGTAFRSRQPVGCTWQGMPDAKITTRILWLEGLEPGFNRGNGVDSHERYIYIHGTGDETTLGRPASCGCVHLAAADLVPLFDTTPSGTLVWIG
ncbi:MAG: L,D-transpeptidase [Verrucomicrobiota bacterium]